MELKTNNQSPTLTQCHLIYLIPEKVLYHEDSDDGGFILIHSSSKAATTEPYESDAHFFFCPNSNQLLHIGAIGFFRFMLRYF